MNDHKKMIKTDAHKMPEHIKKKILMFFAKKSVPKILAKQKCGVVNNVS